MIKKVIEYTDYNGNDRKESFYFHLGQLELAKLEISKQGGLKTYIEKITSEQDVAKIVDLFIEVVNSAYGEKSEDGKRFVKSKELTESFIQSPAYDKLMIDLMQNQQEAEVFIKGLINA